MEEDAERIRECMVREKLDQVALAKAAHVSQATVSRALSGAVHVRRGSAYLRLLAYVGRAMATKARRATTTGRKRVNEAFGRIWDGTAVHAAVVAQIIEDLGALEVKPALRKGSRKRKTALN